MKCKRSGKGVSALTGTLLVVGVVVVLASVFSIYLSPLYTTRPPPTGMFLQVSFERVQLPLFDWDTKQEVKFYAYLLEVEVTSATKVTNLKYVEFCLDKTPIYYLNAEKLYGSGSKLPAPEKNPDVPIKGGETFYIYRYFYVLKTYLVMSNVPPPKGSYGIVIPLPASQFTLKVVDLKSNSLLYFGKIAPTEYADWKFSQLKENSTSAGGGAGYYYGFKISYAGGTVDPKWRDLSIYVGGIYPMIIVPGIWTSQIGPEDLASYYPVYLHGSPWLEYWITKLPPSPTVYNIPPKYVYIVDKNTKTLIGAYFGRGLS